VKAVEARGATSVKWLMGIRGGHGRLFPQVQDGPPRGYSGIAPGVLHTVRRGSLPETAALQKCRVLYRNYPVLPGTVHRRCNHLISLGWRWSTRNRS
jgi:hypothetical protein